MTRLPDYLEENLEILFVGFNPSIRSAELGHHYAGRNNRFWKILFLSDLTPRLYQPEEDAQLLKLGYGLTNIVERPTQAASDITQEEFETGRMILFEKVKRYKPKILCFVGKGVYQAYRKIKQCPWGFQADSSVSNVIEFIAPSSSGLVRLKIKDIVEIYKQLKKSPIE